MLTLIGTNVAHNAENLTAATAVGIGAMFNAGVANQNTVFGRQALRNIEKIYKSLEINMMKMENGNHM